MTNNNISLDTRLSVQEATELTGYTTVSLLRPANRERLIEAGMVKEGRSWVITPQQLVTVGFLNEDLTPTKSPGARGRSKSTPNKAMKLPDDPVVIDGEIKNREETLTENERRLDELAEKMTEFRNIEREHNKLRENSKTVRDELNALTKHRKRLARDAAKRVEAVEAEIARKREELKALKSLAKESTE